MNIIAETARRAESQSPTALNEKIRRATADRVACLEGRPEAIRERLRELDREWDIERCLETGASTLTLTGLILGTTVNRKWLWLSGIVQGFFFQHAIQGWCPPLPLFRAAGVRTQREIEAERHVLKAMLGQYGESPNGASTGSDGTNAHRLLGRALS
jgi:hypothetical protein